MVLILARATTKALLFATVLMLNAAFAFADDVILTGHVRDHQGRPLDVVRIALDSAGRRILERTIELKPGGEVQLNVGPVDQRELRCEIFAAGFEPAKISTVVQEQQALLGIVELKPYVELGPVSILETSQGKSAFLDFWITSRRSQSLMIKQVVVSAEEEPRNDACFESMPRLTLSFDSIAVAGNPTGQVEDRELKASLQVRSGSETEPASGFRVRGSLHRDQCGTSVLKLTAPYSFALESQDQDKPRKVRLEVPLQFEVKGAGTVRPNWYNASIHLLLEGGDTISAQPGG